MHRFLRVLPVAALLAAAPLAACGGDDDDDTPITEAPLTTASSESVTVPGESPDNTGPATSGNDTSMSSVPGNGAGTGAGDDDSGTGDTVSPDDSAPTVATTSG